MPPYCEKFLISHQITKLPLFCQEKISCKLFKEPELKDVCVITSPIELPDSTGKLILQLPWHKYGVLITALLAITS